jgi:hypothetical protein
MSDWQLAGKPIPFPYVGNVTHSRLRTVCCFGKFAMTVFPRNEREVHLAGPAWVLVV